MGKFYSSEPILARDMNPAPSKGINYFEQIQAMHQQVREFVEQQEPEFKVTSVAGDETTNYIPTMQSRHEIAPSNAEFVLVEIKMRFSVDARYLASDKHLSCEVLVTSDGKLHMGKRSITIYA